MIEDFLLSTFPPSDVKTTVYYLNGIKLGNAHYRTKGYFTSSRYTGGDPIEVRTKGYFTSGDILRNFELLIFLEEFVIFTTKSSVFCCANTGTVNTMRNKDLVTSGRLERNLVPNIFLEKVITIKNHELFSGRIYIFAKDSAYEMPRENKRKLLMEAEGVSLVLTKTNSIYIHF